MRHAKVMLDVRGLADDRRVVRDIKSFCGRTGHELLAANEGRDGFELWIRKRAKGAA